MKYLKFILSFALVASMSLVAFSCGGDEPSNPSNPETPSTPDTPSTPETDTFAKGADVSWLTELEDQGYKFYTDAGKEMECMQLLRDECGVNSIRLRVWVNPTQGYNSKADVVKKAKRAAALGQRLMVDFHFSDSWADPGQQVTPQQWQSYNITQLKEAVSAHVTDVLSALKAEGITPEWVQIGNETADGFLYPLGKIGDYPKNFADLVTTGHNAAKAVFPDCITIVHTDSGDNKWRYDYVFGTLKKYNGQYDMIGVSFYPAVATWKSQADELIQNLKNAKATYGKPTMICEVGQVATEIQASTDMMYYLVNGCKDGVSEGIFWWEPEAPIGYNGGYDKGCFINNRPTTALDAFVKD